MIELTEDESLTETEKYSEEKITSHFAKDNILDKTCIGYFRGSWDDCLEFANKLKDNGS